MGLSDIVVVIPAYNPSTQLITLTQNLITMGLCHIVVVNDGSSKEFQEVFDTLPVKVINHAINMGKGRALKYAFNYCLNNFKNIKGIVTADADGQHVSHDIYAVATLINSENKALVIGARLFDIQVPFRSKFGNVLTRNIFKLVTGQKVKDSQSGLRGIPVDFLPQLLSLEGEGYEYETNMLLYAKEFGLVIKEISIKTIYIDNNKSSHFNPIKDSIKIYFLILRFISSSLLTVAFDYFVFFCSFFFSKHLLFSVVFARFLASILNFALNKNYVFKRRRSFYKQMVKYYFLFLCLMSTSFFLISALGYYLGISVLVSKIISECFLFPINFKIQRDFIFNRKRN